MRKLLSALLLIPSLTLAQGSQGAFWAEKSVLCDEIKTVLDKLRDKYGETPVWSGHGKGDIDANSSLMVLQNPKTRSWTILQFNKEVACIMAVGDGGQYEGLKI